MAMNFPNNQAVNDMFMVGTDMRSWNGLAWEVLPPELESKASLFSNPTFTGTVNGITATMIGLGTVEVSVGRT